MNERSKSRTAAIIVALIAMALLGVTPLIAPEAFAWGRVFGGGFGRDFGDQVFANRGFYQETPYEGGGAGSYAGQGASATYIYPSRGQSPQQEQSDRAGCYTWATQQTGFNPANPQIPGGPPPMPGSPEGGLVRGAIGGAAMGAIGGAIGGNAGVGAGIGGAVGGLFGGMRRRRWMEQEEFQQSAYLAQRQDALDQGRGNFNQAFAVCMTGRGYTVG